MRIFPGSRPGQKATIFDEATRLLEDGYSHDMVLNEYPAEREWLAPLLQMRRDFEATVEAEQPSYYFEASLKSRFLEAARERKYRPVQPRQAPGVARVRNLVATASVLSGTAAAGVVTYGFVTADQAVPGDWNYSFKQTTERLEYALANGEDKVDVQINQAQERVYEIKVLSERGGLSPAQVRRLEQEAGQLRSQIEKTENITPVQKVQLRALEDLTVTVLEDVTKKDSGIKPAADSARTAVAEAVAAGGVGTAVGIAEPPAAVTTSATPSAAATTTPAAAAAVPSASPTLPAAAIATATPEPATETTPPETETPTPEPETPTPEPETQTPEPETPTPETPTATPTASNEVATPQPQVSASPEVVEETEPVE